LKFAATTLTTKTLGVIKFGTKSTPKIFSPKYGKMANIFNALISYEGDNGFIITLYEMFVNSNAKVIIYQKQLN